ncbi:hypothetical protein WJX75_000404 [Coccomyxa subellipsoidea]|uniref:F-box domain-containing protein n=1 Tax=Coccomyxa subellipsoidea TaxID=248742 RepID=A0ABR2YYZ8_9CHLO
MEIVLHGESHASSLYKFLKSHIKDGLKVVKRLTISLKLSDHLDEVSPAPETVLFYLSAAVSACSPTVTTLKLENIFFRDFFRETEVDQKERMSLLWATMSCQQLRRLHINVQLYKQMCKFCDNAIFWMCGAMPKLAILQWKESGANFTSMPLIFSEDFLAKLAAGPPNGLQLLQTDNFSYTFVGEYSAPPGFPPREPDFLQCLALHNVAREFEVELGTKLARYPRLEELYLAPFKVPAEKPFNFSHLCPHLQNLRVLVLIIVGGCTFSDPDESWLLELPKLEILAIENLCELLPPLGGLGSARNLTTLKVIFSAFQEENIHPTVAQSLKQVFPQLSQVYLYPVQEVAAITQGAEPAEALPYSGDLGSIQQPKSFGDLCNAAGTCKEFWKYVSAVETLETVLNGESQAFSLDRFLLAHTKEGLQMKHLALSLNPPEEATPAPLAVTCSVNLAVAMAYLTLTKLKLENIYFPDILPGAVKSAKDITPLLNAIMQEICTWAIVFQ